MIDEVQSPTRKRFQQLVKAAEIGIAENAILLNANTQLRNANRIRRKQDQRVRSKSRVLSAKEAQTLKRKAEEKEVEIERKKQKKSLFRNHLPLTICRERQKNRVQKFGRTQLFMVQVGWHLS